MNLSGLLLILVIAVPIMLLVGAVYFAATQNADVRFDSYDPYASPPPKDIWEYICLRYSEVEPFGFQVVAYLRQTGQVMGFTTSVTLMKSLESRDHAAVVSILKPGAQTASAGTSYFEFTTEFDNGVEVDTNNSHTLSGTFAHPDTRFIFQFPQIENAAQLFRIHTYLCWKHGGGASKILLPDGGEIAGLTRSCLKDLDYQVEAGLMRLSGGRYRPTLRGAVMMTVKSVWPFVAIRRSRAATQSSRILEEMQSWESQTLPT